jgi:hypothetical protein
MGSYLSVPSYSRNTVTLEPIVKKADTEEVQEARTSVPSELQRVAKVMETTSPITSDHVEVYIKGEKKEPKEEPKREFLEVTEAPKMVDLMIVKKDEVVEEPSNAVKSDANTKSYRRIEIIEEVNLPENALEDNPILFSADELKQHILSMTEQSNEQHKEKVRTFHKKACDELLHKVKPYEHSKPVDSDDEDIAPLSREELRRHVLRELNNNSKKVNVAITEKSVPVYLKEISKEKIKTPPLEPVKEETVQDVHPFILEYGVHPIKTNAIMIDNRIYHKNPLNIPVTPVASVAPAPVVQAAPKNAHQAVDKKNKRKKH